MEETSINVKNVDILDIFTNSKKGITVGENDHIDTDSVNNINFNFYDLHEFHTLNNAQSDKQLFSLLHSNIESLCAKEDRLKILVTNLNHKFDVIALTETWNPEISSHKFHPPIIEGYHNYEGITDHRRKEGCGFYIKNSVNYTTRNDLEFKSHNNQHDFECKWIEMIGGKTR